MIFAASTHARASCDGERSPIRERRTRPDFASQSVCLADVKNYGSPHFTTG